MLGFTLDILGSGNSAGTANAINTSLTLSQTALGTNQATAFPLVTQSTEFTTVGSGTGAVLPGVGGRATSGDSIFVANGGANALLVYPPLGFKIGTAAANASVSVAAGKCGTFIFRGDGNYYGLLSA